MVNNKKNRSLILDAELDTAHYQYSVTELITQPLSFVINMSPEEMPTCSYPFITLNVSIPKVLAVIQNVKVLQVHHDVLQRTPFWEELRGDGVNESFLWQDEKNCCYHTVLILESFLWKLWAWKWWCVIF